MATVIQRRRAGLSPIGIPLAVGRSDGGGSGAFRYSGIGADQTNRRRREWVDGIRVGRRLGLDGAAFGLEAAGFGAGAPALALGGGEAPVETTIG